MFIDTHCHINMMVKKTFDTLLTAQEITAAQAIVEQAFKQNVNIIINVGTSVPESLNCVTLARHNTHLYAAIGLHPNDCTQDWRQDLSTLQSLLEERTVNKIVAIGECGLDYHYPDYDKQRQKDAFRAQIEMALQAHLPLIVHTRNAAEDTLAVLDEYKNTMPQGIIHCFSEDQAFANECIARGFKLGIGATLTYPKNESLRELFKTISLDSIVLETDAPFLPPQALRGKQNHPEYIVTIATFLAQLRNESLGVIEMVTTDNAIRLFGLKQWTLG